MPPGATKDWLACLEAEAESRGVFVDTDIEGRIFHFHLGETPGIVGKVRYSEGQTRNYENEQGGKFIWHRYDRELERIGNGSERNVVNVTLDVWSKDAFDPDDHHFLFLTQEMLSQDTYSRGDQKIRIEGEGEYSGPLAKYADDWDAIFEYATGNSSPPETATAAGGEAETPTDGGETATLIAQDPETPIAQDSETPIVDDTAGTIRESNRSAVAISETFKRSVYDRYDNQCVLTGIEHPELLTVSHVLDRATHPGIAEDLGNVVLLDWTHHMAFDAGFWTFDESGRVWIEPALETTSLTLEASLIDRHGEKIAPLTRVEADYIEQHNDDLEWWPPR